MNWLNCGLEMCDEKLAVRLIQEEGVKGTYTFSFQRSCMCRPSIEECHLSHCPHWIIKKLHVELVRILELRIGRQKLYQE